MKKDGKYRYSLQFGMSSEEEIRAGELLESLGNKKSKGCLCTIVNLSNTRKTDLIRSAEL